ncbi:MAG: Hpt domain-containing protein, partial [Sulfuriferula sp.]
MSLLPEYDSGPLSWVKAEIDRAIAQVNESVDQFDINNDDPAKLRLAHTFLHQVTGAVEMVGLQGVTLVCQEIEKLVNTLAQGSITPTADIMALIKDATSQIEQYLDGLLQSKPNHELQLFPSYQALRLAQGITTSSETDLFFPDMDGRAPRATSQSSLDQDELKSVLKKSRASFQRGLLGFLRQQDAEQGLMLMRSAVSTIESNMSVPASRTFWWGAGAFVDCLLNHAIEPSFAVKQLCGRIDLQLRRHIEGSPKTAERLLRDLLYFVAQSSDVNEHVMAVKNTFHLTALIPQDQHTLAEINALHPLLKQILGLINNAKEVWIKLISGNADSIAQFQTLINELKIPVHQLNNTPINNLIDEISTIANDYRQLPAARHEATGLEVATTLLFLQNNLEHYENIGGELVQQADIQGQRLRAVAYAETDLADIADVPLLDEYSRQAQEKLLIAQVAQEIQTNIQKIEEILDGFFRDNFHDKKVLAELDRPITEIHGALSIMQLSNANLILEHTHQVIKQLGDPATPINEADFPVIADAISSISLYVDAQRHQRQDAENILHPVLKQLGLIAAIENDESDNVTRVEDDLDTLKAELQLQLNDWQQHPEQEDTKKKLVETLKEISQDAELVGDYQLKQ